MNRTILPTNAESALLESLNEARITANALDGDHAREWDGTYGMVKKALVMALVVAIKDRGEWISGPDANAIAHRIYDEIADNGESVGYNLRLWNQGVITL